MPDLRTDSLLTPEELAEIVKVNVETLAQWRYRKQGPKFIKLGRLVRYRELDVRAWLDSRAVSEGS